MPRPCIDAVDAIELTETLQLSRHRSSAGPACSRDMVGWRLIPTVPRGPSVTPLITTGRLELRPFRDEDAAELHGIFSDPETHTIGDGPLTSLAQTAAWISRRAEAEREHGLLWYAVRGRSDGRMLGNCGLFVGRTGSAEPEIGYEIRRSWQGHGLATEAAAAVLDDALASGISRVWATIRPHNTASLRVAAKIGMIPQHTRPDSRGPLIYLARPLQDKVRSVLMSVADKSALSH